MARNPKPTLVPVEELTKEDMIQILSENPAAPSDQFALCFTGGFDWEGKTQSVQFVGGRYSLDAILVLGKLTTALYMGQLRDYNTMVMYCAEHPEFRLDTPDMNNFGFKLTLGGFEFLIHTSVPLSEANFWIFARFLDSAKQ